jgi:hypothetical protein
MYTFTKIGTFAYTSAQYGIFDKPATSGTMPTTGDFFRADRTWNPDRVLATDVSANTVYLFEKNVSGDWIEQFRRVSQLDSFATDVDLSGNLILIGIPGFRESLGKIESWFYDPFVSFRTESTDYQGWLQVTNTDADKYWGTAASGEFGSRIVISGDYVYAYTSGDNDVTRHSIDFKGNLKLKRMSSSSKVKIAETNHACQVLGIDANTRYRIYDANKNAWIGLIYPTSEFQQAASTANSAVYPTYGLDVNMLAPIGAIDQIAQLDNAALGFKEESLNGLRAYSYLTNEYEDLENAVAVYNKPALSSDGTPIIDQDYMFGLSAERALLSGVEFAHASEIPLDIVYLDFDNGRMYMDSFAMHNEQDYKYDVDATISETVSAAENSVNLYNTRQYSRIGTNETVIWASYTVGKNYANENAISPHPIPESDQTVVEMVEVTPTTGGAFDYEYIEHLYGVNRSNIKTGHKSNIFSVEINNSNLNEAIEDDDLRASVHRIVERAIREFEEKVAPVHTKLWKIIWKGA